MTKKVLIVEDNELNLKLFRDLMEAHGLNTLESRDGKDAVKLAEKERPDLIVMDIQLPKVSGIDVIKEIKEHKSLRHIPIVAVTAFAMREDEEKIMESGCEAYVAKPISVEPFINTIEQYLKLKKSA